MKVSEIEKIGKSIGQFMKSNNITVREAAARSGFAIGTISEITNGKDKKLSYYLILAESLGISQRLLFNSSLSHQERQVLNLFECLTPDKKRAFIELLK